MCLKNCSLKNGAAVILKKEQFLNREMLKFLTKLKKVTHRDLLDILPNLDQELVKGAVAGKQFKDLFFANCKCDKIAEYVKTIVD